MPANKSIVIIKNNNPYSEGEFLENLLKSKYAEYDIQPIRIPILTGNNEEIQKKEREKFVNENEHMLTYSDLVISFAYHTEDDILDMNTMGKVEELFRNDTTKFIFFSWFHPHDIIDRFKNIFSPEKTSYILMDSSICEILQLPFKEEDLYNCIKKSLSK